MVDPDRKINRLSKSDIKFLKQLDEEFKHRYTSDDEEYVKHCNKEIPPVPIRIPYYCRKRFYRGNDRNDNRGGRRGNRGNRGHRDNNRNHPYYRPRGREGHYRGQSRGYGGGSSSTDDRDQTNHYRQSSDPSETRSRPYSKPESTATSDYRAQPYNYRDDSNTSQYRRQPYNRREDFSTSDYRAQPHNYEDGQSYRKRDNSSSSDYKRPFPSGGFNATEEGREQHEGHDMPAYIGDRFREEPGTSTSYQE